MGRLGHTLIPCSRAHGCSAEHKKLPSVNFPHCRTEGDYPNCIQLGSTRVMDCRIAESTTGCLILLQLAFLIDGTISQTSRDMDCLFHIRHIQGFLNPPGHGQLNPNWSPAGIPKSLGILHLPKPLGEQATYSYKYTPMGTDKWSLRYLYNLYFLSRFSYILIHTLTVLHVLTHAHILWLSRY